MRKAVWVTAILVIVILTQMVAVEANPFEPNIFIDSPLQYPEDIYQTPNIPIEVGVMPFETGRQFNDIYYSLDSGPNIKLGITRYETATTITGKGTLENLTNGYHTFSAFSTDTQGNTLSTSRTFLVNTTFSFPTLLLSPNNITYYSEEIPLTYSLGDSKYEVFYQLDGKGHTRLTDNITLSDLSEGQHTITVRASNLTGVLYSEQTANFTIDTINPTPTPTPTVPEFSWLAILPLFVALMFIAVILRHRKTTKTNQDFFPSKCISTLIL
jgi:hypothetical protein